MCGIVACQTSVPALTFLLPALARLEYRGYDSAGVSVQTSEGDVFRARSAGRLAMLEARVARAAGSSLDGVGIGHTRWATHGAVTEANSHPHVDCSGQVHVVHNGIVENAAELRSELLAAGHTMATEVDSETIAHLVEEGLASGADLATSVRSAVSRLSGAWAVAVIRKGFREVVVSARHSPLLVAEGRDGAYAASDAMALAGWAEEMFSLDDGAIAVLRASGIEWPSAAGSPRPSSFRVAASSLHAAGHDVGDHMAAEIAEQPACVGGIVERLAGQIEQATLWRSLRLPDLVRVRFLACGTSLHAAEVLARLLAACDVPAVVVPASEIERDVHAPGTVNVALSQSGETADVLRALDKFAADPLLAVTNVAHSTLARRADALVELGAGPEVGVAATKTFTAQVVTGSAVLLSGLVATQRLSSDAARRHARQLGELPRQLAAAHDLAGRRVEQVVPGLRDAAGFLFMGRGLAVPYAAEGALKLKELTYRWTEHQPAGELKHGPIALIESGTPVIVVDDGHPKLSGNVGEVLARGAGVVRVGGPESELPYRLELADAAPWGPLASVVVMQHFARGLALELGRDVDKPRNLAKSVTVE